MRRTAIVRKTPMKRTPMKKRSKRKQINGHHDKAMLDACKGELCFLRVPGVCLCESGRSTVVPCHSNSQEHGKGMGLKAKDEFTVPGCFACHHWLDQGKAPKGLKFAVFDDALSRWELVRKEKMEWKK